MSVDILGTSWDQCRSMVQYSFTSTETRRLVRTDSPGRPPRLSHSSWTMWNSNVRLGQNGYIRHFIRAARQSGHYPATLLLRQHTHARRHTHTHTHTRTHALTHARTAHPHTHTHTHTLTHTHTDTHTHTHTCAQNLHQRPYPLGCVSV